MAKHSFIGYIFSLISLCFISNTKANDVLLTDYIANKYTVSTLGPEKKTTVDDTKPNGFSETLQKEFAANPLSLSDHEIQQIAFSLALRNRTFNTDTIDQSFIDKLELVGGGENKTQHLIASLVNDYINTAVGNAFTALTLCHPTTDIEILHDRQQIISTLTTHEQLLEELDASLKTIHSAEKKSFIFWQEKPIVNEKTLALLRFGWINKYIELNTSPLALELTNKYLWLFSEASMPIGFLQARAYCANNNYPTALSVINGYLATYIILTPLIKYYIDSTLIKNEVIICNHLQDILISTASHINELKNISLAITQHTSLINLLPSLKPLADFADTTKYSKKLNKLLSILDTKTFTQEPSILSYTGRVLAAYELMKQVKDELAPVFAAAGELDMYVALAKLYNAHEGKTARYCMVNFVENSATPVLEAHNFWNPFINADTVITNDAAFNRSCPNSILTGPNTGGKSTVIKGIMINALMAQTFGIAPSESLTMTPFTKLNCFMNISDDIAMGASLFKSEVTRAKKLLEMVQTLDKNEFSFVIIDEVFTGTSPKEGEMAALRFAEHLGTYTNNISIIATHYPKMVDLQAQNNGRFYNHHVEILRNDDNSLNRTFKFKNGPSFFNVAFDILEEEGLFI